MVKIWEKWFSILLAKEKGLYIMRILWQLTAFHHWLVMKCLLQLSVCQYNVMYVVLG